MRHYKCAAETGNPKACFNLAVMYDNGDGVEGDLTDAFKWYMRAAEEE